jgi:Fe-S cluster assembly protein SufD
MTAVEDLKPVSQETAHELGGDGSSVAADLRHRAWNAYENFPLPSREDEAWRRTDISALDLERFRLSSDGAQALAEVPPQFAGLAGEDEALLLFQDRGLFRRLPKEWEEKGLVFTDLRSALKTHKALVEKHLLKAVSPRRGKFEALNGALWTRGVFLYVPKGLDVSLTLRGGYGATLSDGQASLPHTLAVVEEGARVTYFDEYVSSGVSGGEALSCAGVELFLGPDSQMTYLNIQRLGAGVSHFLTQNALLQPNARLTTLAVALGGTLSKANFGCELVGRGASSQLYGLVFGDGGQRFTHHTQQDHQVPDTTSDLLFKAALKDSARSVYTGMIRIAKEAQRTSSYQANRNLLLSPTARANTIPMLEILADDVKCGHRNST